MCNWVAKKVYEHPMTATYPLRIWYVMPPFSSVWVRITVRQSKSLTALNALSFGIVGMFI